MKDTILIKRYRSTGDMKVLQRLYLSYQPYVFRQCMSILKHPQDSEDACVDIFLELKEKLLKHEVTNFSAWLYRVVKNHCLKRLRKKSQLLFEGMDNSIEKSEISENVDHLDDILEKLPDAIERLKEEQRWCIVLFYLQGKSYQEIEKIKGYPFNKIKSSIQHGKKNLKKILSQYGEPL